MLSPPSPHPVTNAATSMDMSLKFLWPATCRRQHMRKSVGTRRRSCLRGLLACSHLKNHALSVVLSCIISSTTIYASHTSVYLVAVIVPSISCASFSHRRRAVPHTRTPTFAAQKRSRCFGDCFMPLQQSQFLSHPAFRLCLQPPRTLPESHFTLLSRPASCATPSAPSTTWAASAVAFSRGCSALIKHLFFY